MDSDVKEDWIQALRSGDYTQGQGTMKKKKDGDVRHCCLGVLCEILPGHWAKKEKGFTYVYKDDFASRVLPGSVVEDVGLSSDEPQVEIDGGQVELSILNDGKMGLKRYTFDEIADLIEEQL